MTRMTRRRSPPGPLDRTYNRPLQPPVGICATPVHRKRPLSPRLVVTPSGLLKLLSDVAQFAFVDARLEATARDPKLSTPICVEIERKSIWSFVHGDDAIPAVCRSGRSLSNDDFLLGEGGTDFSPNQITRWT